MALVLLGLVGLAVVVLLNLTGVISESARAPSARGTGGPSLVVDARAGRAGSFGLSDRPATASDTYGRSQKPASGPGGGLPIGVDADAVGRPGGYAFPAPCDEPQPDRAGDGTSGELGVTELSFRGVGVEFCRERAFIVVVTGRGSQTTRGARIGEPLEQARSRHPSLRCAMSPGSTTPPVPVFPYCTGRIAKRRYLWLGQDPVSSIAIASVRLGR